MNAANILVEIGYQLGSMSGNINKGRERPDVDLYLEFKSSNSKGGYAFR